MLIDADRSARERTRRILERDRSLQVVAEAESATAALAAAMSAPDVLVVSAATADLAEIAPHHPTPHPLAALPVIVLVPGNSRDINGASALEHAVGIVASDAAAAELAIAVRRAARSGQQGPRMASEEPDPYEFLTSRERQILWIIWQGKAPKEIAAILGCRPATIRSHHARILAKLHLRNDVELGRFLAQHPPPPPQAQ